MRRLATILSVSSALIVAGCAKESKPPDQELRPAARVEPGEFVTLDAFLIAPVDYLGVRVQGTARVSEVVSDRGFWLGTGDNRVFALVREDVPRHEMIDINAGQTIRFSGYAFGPAAVDDMAGTLEPQTRNILQNQPAFIGMYWRDIQMVKPAQGNQDQTGQ